MVVMHRRRGGVNGIYRCEIPDALGVTQTIYIEASTGEWSVQTVHSYCIVFVAEAVSQKYPLEPVCLVWPFLEQTQL